MLLLAYFFSSNPKQLDKASDHSHTVFITQPPNFDKEPKRSKADDTDWHRTVGLSLDPLFDEMGYNTDVEVDLSMKSQRADIIVVRRVGNIVKQPNLPEDFWRAFDNLNERNIITFKSYSESFNDFAFAELYGHYTNYCKTKGAKPEQVNLYVITHHFPRDVLAPFMEKELGEKAMVEEVIEDEVYDLRPGNLPPIRIIVCRTTSNPILALFSGDREKVLENYERIKRETTLLNKVSRYLDKIRAYYGEIVKNMYTREDFIRDNPPKDRPTLLPWENELWDANMHQAELKGIEQGIEQGLIQARTTLFQLLKHRYGIDETEQERIQKLIQPIRSLKLLGQLTNLCLDCEDLNGFMARLDEKLTESNPSDFDKPITF